MIFQYNGIIPQCFAVVKFLNKISVKSYSENNFSDLMTVIDSMPQVHKSILIILIFRQKYNIIGLRRTETDIFLASVNRTFLAAAHNIVVCILRLYYISAQLTLKSVPLYFPMFHIIIPFYRASY